MATLDARLSRLEAAHRGAAVARADDEAHRELFDALRGAIGYDVRVASVVVGIADRALRGEITDDDMRVYDALPTAALERVGMTALELLEVYARLVRLITATGQTSLL